MRTAPRWIHRRVESAVLQDESTIRRHLTVDFEVPNQDSDAGDPCLLPLVLLRKSPPVLHIDLKDEEGKSLPLLTRSENAQISARALASVVEHAIGAHAHPLLMQTCRRIAVEPPPAAAEAFGSLLDILRSHTTNLSPQQRYRRSLRVGRAIQIARSMIGNSVIWVPVGNARSDRRVVKFAYDEPLQILSGIWARVGTFLGFRSLLVAFATPHLRDAGTYHFQMSVPAELELRHLSFEADVREMRDPSTSRRPSFQRVFRREAHLYINLRDTETRYSDRIQVRVRPGRRGFLSFATSASLLITALLTSAWFLHDDIVADSGGEIASPVLLLIPALLVAVVVRPGEHAFTGYLLTGPRYLMLAAGVFSAVAAGALAVLEPEDPTALDDVWLACAGGTALVSACMMGAWLASLTPRIRSVVLFTALGVVSCLAAILWIDLPAFPVIAAALSVISLIWAYILGERTPQFARTEGNSAVNANPVV